MEATDQPDTTPPPESGTRPSVRSPRRLIVLGGPTATGKTAAAIAVARRFAGEIVSADSRLVYRGLDIGTAKPTAEERAAAPHRLIDIVDPDEEWSEICAGVLQV